MEVYKEEVISNRIPFPVDIFLRDNLNEHIVSDPHWHECFEILYMLEGSATQQVNDKRFLVKKNDIIILRAGDIHSTFCVPNENTKILVVKFLPEIIDTHYPRVFESKYIHAFLNNNLHQISHIENSQQNTSMIHHILVNLLDEFIRKEEGYEIFIKGYIYQLIASLVRHDIIKIHSLVFKDQEIEKLEKVFRYIEQNFAEKLELKKVADMMNFSYAHFSRYFKKVTGKTFKEYVDFVRICEVEKLILSKGMNISEAAYEAGFCNISSFNRVFKRVRGYSPSYIKRSI